MSNVNFDTFYLTGDVIVKSFEMTTRIDDDVEWIKANPDNVVVGRHFSGERWIMDQSCKSLCDDMELDTVMGSMKNLDEDHHISKIIEMYELTGAIPVPMDSELRKWGQV